MDTVEYSQHLVRVGKNIMRIAENVESAADNEIKGTDKEDAIKQARAKLADYNSVIMKLSLDSKILEAEFVETFKDDIELIRKLLNVIDNKSNV